MFSNRKQQETHETTAIAERGGGVQYRKFCTTPEQ